MECKAIPYRPQASGKRRGSERHEETTVRGGSLGRALSLIVALAMVLGMCPAWAIAEEVDVEPDDEVVVEVQDEGDGAAAVEEQGKDDGDVIEAQVAYVASVTIDETTTNYGTISEAVSNWSNGATMTLLDDVTTSSTIEVTGTKTLDLNGHGITKNGGNNVIWIRGGNLTVNDSDTTTTHYFNVDDGKAVNVNATAGAQSFNGGYITGGTGQSFNSTFGSDGGGVYLDGGTFTLNGGTILGNSTGGDNGGGVEIYEGTMTMYGGTICYNKRIGVGLRAGSSAASDQNRDGRATTAKFEMYGGVIANNENRGIRGDGYWCYGDDSATFYGGSVINNGINSGGWGIGAKNITIAGGVTVSGNANGVTLTSSTVTISGSPVISVNTGANLKVNDNQTINVTGSLSGANIGISMQTPGVFTSGTDTSLNDASKFTSDNKSYAVGKNSDGQLYLDNAYTVTYAANGGSSTMTDSNSPYLSGSTVTVLQNAFTAPDNHVFAGFKIGDSATIYANEVDGIIGATTSFTITGNTTLTAQWEVPTYKILDDSNKPTIHLPNNHTTPVIGDTLTAVTSAYPVTYQWYVGGTAVPEATGKTYTVKTEDYGKTIYVVATQSQDSQGNDLDTPITKQSEATGAVVKKDGPAAPTEATAGFVPNYEDETYDVGDDYEVSSTNDEAGTPVDSLTPVLDGAAPKVYIRVKETDDTKPGEWLEVPLPARPDAPTGLTTENATNSTTADGKIKGTTTEMEYSPDDGTTWHDASDGSTSVKPGTYLVRARATDDTPAGKAAEVTVGSREIILSDGQRPTAKTGLVYTGSKQELVNKPAKGLPEGAKEMQYALGTDATTAPTTGWSTSIPTGTDVGTYYVWYKAVGDANHNDTEPACVTSTISAKADPAPAKVSRPSTEGHPASGTLDVAWKAAEGAKSYEVQWRKRGGKWQTTTVRSRKFTVSGLKRGTLYEVRVRAKAGSKTGEWSSVVRRWLRGPSSVKAKAGSKPGTIKVSWKRDAKASAGTKVCVYAKKGGKLVKTAKAKAGKTSVIVSGIKAGKRYFVRVRPLRRASGTTYTGTLCSHRSVRAAK